MPSWKRLTLYVVGLVLAILVMAGVLAFAFNGFWVDLWWFDSLGYAGYFWSRQLYATLVYVLGVSFFFALFFINFWVGGKYLGARRPADDDSPAADALSPDRSPDIPPQRRKGPSQLLYRKFQQRSLAVYLPLTLVLAILVALPLLFSWETAMMYLLAPNMGTQASMYGFDVSFYLFSLPLYELLFAETLAALLIALAGLALLYWAEHKVMPRDHGYLRRGARIHLSLITLLVFIMGALYFVGDTQHLLYTDEHLPMFYGPGYTEMQVTLPLIWASGLLTLVVGGLVVYFLNTRRGVIYLGGATALLLVVVASRYTPALSDSIEEFIVQPNELTRQAPHIENNIDATLAAYALDDVETRHYAIREDAWGQVTPEMERSLQNVPVWDEDGLLKVYRDLQEIRSYYSFHQIDVGRYTINDSYQQVFLGAREIDINKLHDPLQTWVNRWLKYTHGYGAVMTPAAQDAAEPTNWLMQGIPPTAKAGLSGLSLEQPALYYGVGTYLPVIAPNASQELDYASKDEVNYSDYTGDGGVPMGSLFHKLMFALYFREQNIFYTTQTTDDSKLLFRRNVQERIKTLTPFLTLVPSPYLVMAEGRLWWIQNAVTHSDRYPNATPYDGRFGYFARPFNYIRESIKIVVDAYNGSVDYYLADPSDPIAVAYARMYPQLFKRMEEMPRALKQHVRYPKALFDVQMDVYAHYHQNNAQTFYNREDVWEFPSVEWRDNMHAVTSYYLTLNLVHPDRFQYSLFVPMTPRGQRGMRALALVGSDGEDYGRIVVYNFPKGTLVYGPAQVDAFIKQDPYITQELTLWDQQGSNADRGRMVVVPIDGIVTYIQGIFLEADSESRMPQLARVIVSQGPLVVMEETLEEGVHSLNALILEKARDAKTEARQARKERAPLAPPSVVPETEGVIRGTSDEQPPPTASSEPEMRTGL